VRHLLASANYVHAGANIRPSVRSTPAWELGGRNDRIEPISCDATSGELLRLLVENIKDYAIFVTNPEGRVHSWNPGAERLLGYSGGEIVGQSADFFTQEDIQGGVPDREMRKAAETGRGEDERWYVRKDGSRFWSGGTITPLWDEEQSLRGFAKIIRDRTAQKHSDDDLKIALERLRPIKAAWRGLS